MHAVCKTVPSGAAAKLSREPNGGTLANRLPMVDKPPGNPSWIGASTIGVPSVLERPPMQHQLHLSPAYSGTASATSRK